MSFLKCPCEVVSRRCDNKPSQHFDIGSRIDGFIGNLLAFGLPVTLIDIRPLDAKIEGLTFIQDDATNLEKIEKDSIISLSALCSLEHFGLGRYGDSIDPDACFKAFKSIQEVISIGGFLYISVPIGKEHLEFNAHRVFFASTIIKEFDKFDLIEFSVIDGSQESAINVNCKIDKYDNFNGYKMGLFKFCKKNHKYI